MTSTNDDPRDENIKENEPDVASGSDSTSDSELVTPEDSTVDDSLEGPLLGPEPADPASDDSEESVPEQEIESVDPDSEASIENSNDKPLDDSTPDYESSVADDDGMASFHSEDEVAEPVETDEDANHPVDEDQPSATAETQQDPVVVKDSSDHAKLEDEPQFRGALLAGWGVAAVALLAIAGYGIFNATQTTVPQASVSYSADDKDASDKTCKVFLGEDLKCEVFLKNSYDVPGGGLIEQSVDAGSRVKKDSTVKVIYSSGPQFGEMPDVSGLPLDTASTELSKEGIKIGGTKKVDNSGLPAGHIVGSSIRPGVVTDNGQEIQLTVSSGVTTTPDFTNMSADQALKEASDAGLTAKIDWVEGAAPYGVVTGQSVEEGEENADGMITVEVSRPYEGISLQIPKVEGMTQDEALESLYDSGITMLNIVEVEGDKDEILSVSPSESQYVSSSQVVTVVVSTTDHE